MKDLQDKLEENKIDIATLNCDKCEEYSIGLYHKDKFYCLDCLESDD